MQRLVAQARDRVDPDGASGELAQQWIAEAVAKSPRIALSKSEAAAALGISVEFFDEHIAPDLRVVRRGRRRLYPFWDLLHWLWRASDPPPGRQPVIAPLGALLVAMQHAHLLRMLTLPVALLAGPVVHAWPFS